tara:strand:+ start:2229 stop:2825 length:597 start_codon:yes stop_codon:yes gene_type:complete
MITLKKGAMFGLDARIALAIFGALSVISGAALYSAIEQAKLTAALTHMQELVKAYESGILDTGDVDLRLGELAENYDTLENWNGPYFPGASSSKSYLDVTLGGFDYTFFITNVDRTESKALSSGFGSCSANCQKFIVASDSTSIPEGVNLRYYAEKLDELIDNDDGHTKGKIRYRIADQSGGTHLISLYYDLGIPKMH